MPGKYTVTMYKEHNGEITQLTQPQEFTTKILDNKTLPADNGAELLAFHKRAFEMRKNLEGANDYIKSVSTKLKVYENAILLTNEVDNSLLKKINSINSSLDKVNILVNGDNAKSSRNANQTPSMSSRLGGLLYGFWYSSSEPTKTNVETLNLLEKQFNQVKAGLEKIDSDCNAIETELTNSNSPWFLDKLRK